MWLETQIGVVSVALADIAPVADGFQMQDRMLECIGAQTGIIHQKEIGVLFIEIDACKC